MNPLLHGYLLGLGICVLGLIFYLWHRAQKGH